MRAWNSVTQGDLLRPGPAGFAILMAGLLLSLAPVSQRIEAAYYDFLQRIQSRTGSYDVVLIDTARLAADGSSVWEAGRLPDLLTALGRAGTRLVIPVEPPPLSWALPDSAQLATLEEIERRSRQSASNVAPAASDSRIEAFGKQLAEMRRRSELQASIIEAGATWRNLIIAVPTFDGARGAPGPSTCGKHLLELGAPSAQSSGDRARRVRTVTPLPESLCRAALGAGHAEFWPDSDGVVRRSDLLVNASGALVPSAALRAALAVSFPGDEAAEVTAAAITSGSQVLRTTAGENLATLIRFYPVGPTGRAFETVAAEDVLRGGAAGKRVAGRIAVLGYAGPDSGDAGYLTPLGDRMPPALLLATTLSNLLQQDYLIRSSWLSWVESALLLVLGVAVVLWGGHLAPALAAMVAILLAATLLAAEAFLVLRSGIWVQFATAAAFTLFGMGVIRFLRPRLRQPAMPEPGLVAVPAGVPMAGPARGNGGDELDLAFSMLRHQPPSDNGKQRLYDVALEHARRRDLAKAERVLRHLAGIDPNYRNAGEKLKKLAGLRNAVTPLTAEPTARPEPAIVPLTQESESLSGRTIGRYQIEQPIGRGAMATVYLGRDPKINRRVAIKTIALAEEFSDTDLANARTQFLREAESAGRLNHPNIISIYDAGEDEQVAYLAMEYFPGKALSYYAQQGYLLPPQVVFELMARAAEALHYAHGQHVVHRDVKPANLLYDRNTDTLKITDFGIARLTDTSRTKTGIILGTPSYMSPEQLAGTNVTGQSDLFSLGVTLYQLLTGMPPFRADSIPRLMQKIAHEGHEPLHLLREDMPACVDELLDRALAKAPADRFPSGRAMALALRDCCSSFKVSAAMQSS